jgi:allophanate hydrolase
MSAREALATAIARLDACDDPAVVVARVDGGWLHELAEEIDTRPDAEVPLRGTTFAVKDNIDVLGAPTTAACPAIAYLADRSATAVDRLIAAGSLPVAKVNLDQFATGLVGTRSPFGTPRNPFRADLVPGGSSSGSGVAVATGLTTFALGTDTAGSGRVPAAMCGILGFKPTPGWVSTAGVVPAVHSVDCMSVFAADVATGCRVVEAAAGFDPSDPFARRRPAGPTAPVRVLGVIDVGVLATLGCDPAIVRSYGAACDLLDEIGFDLADIDPGDLFAIGDQLYGGPWVSERLVTVDGFAPPDSALDPAVALILAGSRRHDALAVHRAAAAVGLLRHRADALFDTVDALALPTIGWLVTLDELRTDPIEPNTRLGRFTTFTNLAGMAALTVPLPVPIGDGLPPFSLTLHGPAWSDASLAEAAATLLDEPPVTDVPAGSVVLAVAGAHLRGQALEHQLVDRGARFVRTTTTAPVYRLFAIAGSEPPKPALVHAGEGAPIEVDLWALTPAALGDFLGVIGAPLGLGRVELADGTTVTGFIAEPRALDGAEDITEFGGWRAYRASLP